MIILCFNESGGRSAAEPHCTHHLHTQLHHHRVSFDCFLVFACDHHLRARPDMQPRGESWSWSWPQHIVLLQPAQLPAAAFQSDFQLISSNHSVVTLSVSQQQSCNTTTPPVLCRHQQHPTQRRIVAAAAVGAQWAAAHHVQHTPPQLLLIQNQPRPRGAPAESSLISLPGHPAGRTSHHVMGACSQPTAAATSTTVAISSESLHTEPQRFYRTPAASQQSQIKVTDTMQSWKVCGKPAQISRCSVPAPISL